MEVTLLNSSEGFKFEEYGESITVQRTIRQPSGGGFALLDHDGKVGPDRVLLLLFLLLLPQVALTLLHATGNGP